jgi:dUTP pyrophosphatase
MTTIHFTKIHQDAIIPTKATTRSIGLDLFSTENRVIPPGHRAVVSTGISVNIPDGTYGRIAPRSGLAVKNGIAVGAGVIDPDYTGELRVVLFNHDLESPYTIEPGHRIAQIIFEKAMNPIVTVERSNDRGDNGFGSSGV